MFKKLVAVAFALVFAVACQSKSMNGAGMAGGQVVPGTQSDLEANVGDRVFFGFDSSALNEESKAVLKRQVAWLQQYPNLNVTVEGHADERGTREYNLALGERRAESVKKFLIHSGIDAKRVSTISYGKERPAVAGEGEAVWSQNRRSVTVVSMQ
jgi:peptidoglycan-associated lipoprotein